MTSRAVVAALTLMVLVIGAWLCYAIVSFVTVGVLTGAAESRTRSPRSEAPPADPIAAYRDRLILVQEELRIRGYHPGPVDGVFRPQTSASLKAFQRDEGLEMSGRATTQTLERLGIQVPPSRLPRRPSPSPIGFVASHDLQAAADLPPKN